MTEHEPTAEAPEIVVDPAPVPFAPPTLPAVDTDTDTEQKASTWKRPIGVPVWAAAVAVLVVLAAIATLGLVLQTRLDTTNNDLDTANDSITALQQDLERTKKRADTAESKIEDAELAAIQADNAQATAERQRDAALEREQTAIDDMNAVLTRYDPEIKAALAGIVNTASDAACTAGQNAGFDGEPEPRLATALVQVIASLPSSAFPDSDPAKLLPMDALQRTLSDCYVAGQTRKKIDGPHSDGIYTVGVEISAGKWRSDGTGDRCYWQISPDGQPDDILSNHAGNAGGTVTLAVGQEFETNRCGNWTKV